jgi:outer membrane protein OmpA-like peptidoglycan-associated protein
VKKSYNNQLLTSLVAIACCMPHAFAQSVRNERPLQIGEFSREEQSRYDAMQIRLDKLSGLKKSANPWDAYNLAKAQAWLNFAFDLRTQRDDLSEPEPFAESDKLITKLETQSGNISHDTPIIPSSMKIRDDLWQKADAMKRDANFTCAAQWIAQFEVQLVQAGTANKQLGWHSANPYVKTAELNAKGIESSLQACANKKIAVETPVASPVKRTIEPVEKLVPLFEPVVTATPVQVPAVQAATTQATISQPVVTITPVTTDKTPSSVVAVVANNLKSLPDRVHFAFDSSVISSSAAAVLNQMATVLSATPDAQIVLRGHTDSSGSLSYNMRLGLKRAAAAKRHLVQMGIAAQRLQLESFGQTKPAITPNGKPNQAYSRRVELKVANDAATLTPQYADVQLRKIVNKK